MGGEEHAQKLGAENHGNNHNVEGNRPGRTTKESNTNARLMGSRR